MRLRLPGILAATVAVALCPAAPAAAANTKWTAAPPVPTPAGATNSILQDVSVLSPNDVWTVGAWWGPGATLSPLAVHWDGAAWTPASPPPPPAPQSEYGLAGVDGVAPHDVWAVGGTGLPTGQPPASSPIVVHYDGTAWSVVPSPSGPDGSRGELIDIDMRTADDGWAVGWTAQGTGAAQPLIQRWRSGQWTRETPPKIGSESRLDSVFSGSADDAWAVGTQLRTDGTPTVLVLHWDGVSWTRVTVPDTGGTTGVASYATLGSVAATSTDVWAAGMTCGSTGGCVPLVLHLSGGVWEVVPAAGGTEVTEIVPFSLTDVWTVGYAIGPTEAEIGHVEHWDGQRFTEDRTIPGTLPSGSITGHPASATALAAAAGDSVSGVLWAVGWSQSTTRTPQVIYRG